MLFLLLFPVLVAGFRASQIHPVERQRNARSEGQRLYLSSAAMGLKCFTLGGIIVYLLHTNIPDEAQIAGWIFPTTLTNHISEWLVRTGVATPQDSVQWAWFIILSGASWFAGDLIRLFAHIYLMLYYRTLRTKWLMMSDILAGSPLDHLLYMAQFNRPPVMISMSNRKVYVGYVLECAEPVQSTGAHQEIILVPLMSGYRHENTLDVTITTYYLTDFEEDLNVILGQANIESAGEFLWEAFDKMQNKKNDYVNDDEEPQTDISLTEAK